jgi:uncharacterized protein YciI
MTNQQSHWVPHCVLLYFSNDQARTRIPDVYPAHSAYATEFRLERPGELVMIGPFADSVNGQAGAMSIFTSREAAEAFAAGDPFVSERVATDVMYRQWLVSPEPDSRPAAHT